MTKKEKLKWPQSVWILRALGVSISAFETKADAEGYAKFMQANGAFDIEICEYIKKDKPILAACNSASKPAFSQGQTKGKVRIK